MSARVPMSSGYGHGRRLRNDEEVVKALSMFGKPKLLPMPKHSAEDTRRSAIQGGGDGFIARTVKKYPFTAGFGGTLIALRLIHGDKVTGT